MYYVLTYKRILFSSSPLLQLGEVARVVRPANIQKTHFTLGAHVLDYQSEYKEVQVRRRRGGEVHVHSVVGVCCSGVCCGVRCSALL